MILTRLNGLYRLLVCAAICLAVAVLIPPDDAGGAVVNEPFKWDGEGLLSVRWVSRVQNGSNFVGQDSGVETSFPAVITIAMVDTADWRVLIGALWSGQTDTVWSTIPFSIKNQSLLVEILDSVQSQSSWMASQASIDSVILWLGYGPDCHSIKGKSADRDTLHIMNDADSLGHILYWHLGGVAGGRPDSVTVRQLII